MKRNKILLTLTALLLLLATALLSCSGEAVYDYRKERISDYITVHASALSGIAVSVPAREVVTDADVEASLREMLLEVAEDKSYPDRVPTASDRVSFLYRVEYEGEPVHGLTNYYGAAPLVLPLTPTTDEDGEPKQEPSYYAALREALSDALVGKAAPSAYRLTERKDGKVGSGNVVYCNISLTTEKDGKIDSERMSAVRIDLLHDDNTSPYYDLFEAMAEMTVGKTADPIRLYDKENAAYLTYTVEPLFVLEEEVMIEAPVTLPSDFDKGGDLASLAGKTVTFLLVPLAVVVAEIPELTDAYVATLTQNVYEGEGAADRFRAFWKEYLQSQKDEVYEEKLYAALEKELLSLCVPTSYPEKALAAANREMYGIFTQSYDNYVRQNGSSRYPTLESYIDDALEIEGDAARAEAVAALERDSVAGYLAYFAAADALGVRPSDEAIESAYAETLLSLATGEAEVYVAYYGETYLHDQIAYQMTREAVLKKLAETAVIMP